MDNYEKRKGINVLFNSYLCSYCYMSILVCNKGGEVRGGGHVGHVEFINNGKYCNKNMKY